MSLKNRNTFYRAKTYFFRGHNHWLIIPSWFLNFIVIQYELLFSRLNFFDSILEFALFFLITYPIIAISIGRWDFKKGSFAVDSEISLVNNPEWKRMRETQQQILEKLNKLNP